MAQPAGISPADRLAPPDGRAWPEAARPDARPGRFPPRRDRADRAAARERSRVPWPKSGGRAVPGDRQCADIDDRESADRLLAALRDLVEHVEELRSEPSARAFVEIPPPSQLRLEQVLLSRDAFFGRTEQVPAEQAAGRIVADMLTAYPPGIPAAVPGERLNTAVVDYLRSGVRAGMVIPDAVDPKLESVRVVVEGADAD